MIFSHGLGVALTDAASRRRAMVQNQLVTRGICDARVLAALETVPRELFVPDLHSSMAYDDCALPISEGQTISQPFTVAFMAEALQLEGPEKVLEVGTGSGYGAAVLGSLAAEIHSVERIRPLVEEARKRLEHLNYDNVHVYESDGTLGLAELAPFDAIVVTAGAQQLPQPYVDQLGDGGRIVIPIGPTQRCQSIFRYVRRGEELSSENLGQFAFVPLIGEHGWDESTL